MRAPWAWHTGRTNNRIRLRIGRMPGLVPACRLAARPVRRARATPALVLPHGRLCTSSQTLSACGVCRVLLSRERTARTPLCGRHGELPCLCRGAPCTAPRFAGDSAQWRMPRLQRRRSSSRGPHARMLGVRSRCPSGGAPCRPSAHLASPAHPSRRLDRRPDVECRRPLAPVIPLSGARHASQGMSRERRVAATAAGGPPRRQDVRAPRRSRRAAGRRLPPLSTAA